MDTKNKIVNEYDNDNIINKKLAENEFIWKNVDVINKKPAENEFIWNNDGKIEYITGDEKLTQYDFYQDNNDIIEEGNIKMQNIDLKDIPMYIIHAHGSNNDKQNLFIPKGIMVIYIEFGKTTTISQNNVLLNAINKDEKLIEKILYNFVNKKEIRSKNNEVKDNGGMIIEYILNNVHYNCNIKCVMYNDKNNVIINNAGITLSFDHGYYYKKNGVDNISTSLSYAYNIKKIMKEKKNENPFNYDRYNEISNGSMFIPYFGQIGRFDELKKTHISDILSSEYNYKNKFNIYENINMKNIDIYVNENIMCANDDRICIFIKSLYYMISKYDENISLEELNIKIWQYIYKYSLFLSKELINITMGITHKSRQYYYDIYKNNISFMNRYENIITLNDVLTQIDNNIINKYKQKYEDSNLNIPNGIVFMLSCSKINADLLSQINNDIYLYIYIQNELKKVGKEQYNNKIIKQEGGGKKLIQYNNEVIYEFISSGSNMQKTIDIICNNSEKTSNDIIYQLYEFYNNMLMHFDDILNYKIKYAINYNNNTKYLDSDSLIHILNFFREKEFKITDDILYMLMDDIQYNNYNENSEKYSDIIQQINSKKNDNIGQYIYYKYYFYRMINSLRCDIYNKNQQHIIIYPHNVRLILQKILSNNDLNNNEYNCITYLNNKFGIFDHIYSFEYCNDIKNINMYYNNNENNDEHYILNIIAGGYSHPKIVLSFMYNYLDYMDELNINNYDVYISDGFDEMILSRVKYNNIINTYLKCIVHLYENQVGKMIELNKDVNNIQNIMLDIIKVIKNQNNVNLLGLREYIDKL
jgi:hypothetical protein